MFIKMRIKRTINIIIDKLKIIRIICLVKQELNYLTVRL